MEHHAGIRKSRDKSPNDFIKYLCIACSNGNEQRKQEKSKDEFIQHCQNLYVEQSGRCALSGVVMQIGKSAKNPWQISIDRIDKSRGFEIGNVRLVAWFINNALNATNDDVLLAFARQLVKVHGMGDSKGDN